MTRRFSPRGATSTTQVNRYGEEARHYIPGAIMSLATETTGKGMNLTGESWITSTCHLSPVTCHLRILTRPPNYSTTGHTPTLDLPAYLPASLYLSYLSVIERKQQRQIYIVVAWRSIGNGTRRLRTGHDCALLSSPMIAILKSPNNEGLQKNIDFTSGRRSDRHLTLSQPNMTKGCWTVLAMHDFSQVYHHPLKPFIPVYKEAYS